MDVLLLTLGASAAGGPELSWPLQGRHKSQTSGSSRPPWALRALCSCHSERGDAFRSARLDAPAPAGCRTPSDLVSEAARGSEWEDTRLAGSLPGASTARPVTKCPPSCSTGGFCVETRSLSMHLPPARLCSLWPLQKPEVLALGWGCAASCFSCVDASDCGGNLGQPMYF